MFDFLFWFWGRGWSTDVPPEPTKPGIELYDAGKAFHYVDDTPQLHLADLEKQFHFVDYGTD